MIEADWIMRGKPRLLLFDPNSGGHHAGYIEHVLRGLSLAGGPGPVVAAVSPRLFAEHPELRTAPDREGWNGVSFLEMPEAPALHGLPLWRKGLGERKLLRKYVEELGPDQVLAMYMDHTQAALATGLHFSYPVRISGLFLRVSHHRPSPGQSVRKRLTQWRKRQVLRLALRNRHAGVFLSADPAVVPTLRALDPAAQAASVPDPVPLFDDYGNAAQTRARYGVDVDRNVFLLFGALAERKGVLQVIEAFRQLSDDQSRAACLLLAGPVELDLQDRLPAAVARLRSERPVQVVEHYGYIHDPEISHLMGAADLVLTAYLDHPGTSSVLIRAAGARRPVLCNNYGLMAEQVRGHLLGQMVDAWRPASIAAGIERFLDDPLTAFDPVSARRFASTQTPECFSRALLDHLGLLNPGGPIPTTSP